MKKSVKALFGAVLSFAFLFICIGYAQLTNVVDISGFAEATPPEGVFIFNATVPDGSSVTVNGYSYCVLNSTATLGSSGTSTVTANITVYNNSDIVYGYNVMKYVGNADAYDNENIIITPDIQRRDTVDPYQYKTFSITYSYKDNTAVANRVLNSVVQFEFLPLDEIPEDGSEFEVEIENLTISVKDVLNHQVETAIVRVKRPEPSEDDEEE